MQFADDRQHKRTHATEVVAAGRDLLGKMEFYQESRREDYFLHGVIEVCLAGDKGDAVANAMCENLLSAAEGDRTHGFEHAQLLKALLAIQPRATLDALFGGDEKVRDAGKGYSRIANPRARARGSGE